MPSKVWPLCNEEVPSWVLLQLCWVLMLVLPNVGGRHSDGRQGRQGGRQAGCSWLAGHGSLFCWANSAESPRCTHLHRLVCHPLLCVCHPLDEANHAHWLHKLTEPITSELQYRL